MSPYEKIAQKYFDNPQEAPFGDYVEWFLRNGYVFSTPEYFVMGKNCRRLAPVEQICDCEHVFDEKESDSGTSLLWLATSNKRYNLCLISYLG